MKTLKTSITMSCIIAFLFFGLFGAVGCQRMVTKVSQPPAGIQILQETVVQPNLQPADSEGFF